MMRKDTLTGHGEDGVKMYIGDYVRYKYVDKNLPDSKGHGEFLDAGCGQGIYKQIAEKKGYEWYGLDKKHNGLDNIKIGDITALPYETEQFEAVICIDVLEHVENDLEAVREMWRVLRKGGTLIIHVPNKNQKHILLEPKINPDHVREGYTFEELGKLFAKTFPRSTVIKPTFNIIEGLAWDLAQFKGAKDTNGGDVVGVLSSVVVNFDPNDYVNYGWIVKVKK